MTRELFTAHLQAVGRLCDAAHRAEDPNTALGLIHRARTRLDAARAMATIEADNRDAQHLSCTQVLPSGPAAPDPGPLARNGELGHDSERATEPVSNDVGLSRG